MLKRATSSGVSSVDLSRLLDCIAQVESGRDDAKVGRSGERSKYQIKECVWRQHLQHELYWLPRFETECYGSVAERVAKKHIKWLHSLIGPRPYAIVLAWNVGYKNWQRSNFNQHNTTFANRVMNLYNE